MEQTKGLDIQRYLQLVLKRRYLFTLTAAAFITAVVVMSYFVQPVYEAKTIVSIEKSFLNDVLRNMGGTQSIDDKTSALSTIMKSRTLIFKVLNELGLDQNKMTEARVEGLIKSIQDRNQINIEFNRSGRRDVDFFTVSFRDHDPKWARDYVNSVVSKYIEETFVAKKEGSIGANRFLLDQINLYREKVGKLDTEIASLKKDRDVIQYDRLRELQKKLDDLLFQYTENHPEVIKVQSEIESLKAKLKTSRQKEVEAAGLSDLPSENKSSNMAGAVRIKHQLSILERERDSNKKIYDDLSAAYSKSEVSSQAEVQDNAATFRIIDLAVLPIKPISPKRINIILLGIVGGIAASFGFIVVLDTFNDSVKDIDTLKSFGIPVLAVIPHIQDPTELIRLRIKNIVFYILSGLFIMLLCVVIGRELIVLP